MRVYKILYLYKVSDVGTLKTTAMRGGVDCSREFRGLIIHEGYDIRNG